MDDTQVQTKANWEQIQLQDGTIARRYPDGSIRNERGHPIPGTKIPNDGYEITHENARSFVDRRMELKRSVMAQAANEAVARGDFKQRYGDMAYLAELSYNAQLKSQNIDDPKQIDASRFIVQETGYSEAKQAETVNNTVNMLVLDEQAAAALIDLRQRLHEQVQGSIDGLGTESDISVRNKVRIDARFDASPTDPKADE